MPKILTVKLIVADDYDMTQACEALDNASLARPVSAPFDLESIECDGVIYENS